MEYYDGSDDLFLKVTPVHGFLHATLVNVTARPIDNVSLAVLPGNGTVEFLTPPPRAFRVDPGRKHVIPLAYENREPRATEVTAIALFPDGDGGINLSGARGELPPNAFAANRAGAWAGTFPVLESVAIPLERPVATADLVSRVAPLTRAGLTQLARTRWVSEDPVLVLEYAYPGRACTIHVPQLGDRGLVEQVQASVCATGGEDLSGISAGYELGRGLTTLHDLLELGLHADDAIALLLEIQRLLAALKIHLPALGRIKDVIGRVESLADLPRADRLALDSLLREVETHLSAP